MEKKPKRIEHQGMVERVSKNSLTINILQQSSCLSCAVKGACSASESDNKEIEVTRFIGHYEVGERVNVFYEQSLGFKALFLGYINPFLILLIVLVVGAQLIGSEEQAGLLALACLVPYYGVLYLLRDKIKKEFSFRVEKLEAEPLSLKNASFEN